MFFFLIALIFLTTKTAVISKGKQSWNEYKDKYGLLFAPEEDQRRKKIFEENNEFINRHNALNDGVILEMNGRGHLETNEIFPCNLLHRGEEENSIPFDLDYSDPIPYRKDWREEGKVSSVKDQNPCGSCYAFSALGSVESQFAIKRNSTPVDLSEQEIVDCSAYLGNFGCDGGYIDTVYKYLRQNGISLFNDYPYLAKLGRCRAAQMKHAYKISGHVYLPSQNETALTIALALKGPISIAIDASSKHFRFYKSGIYNFTDCSSTALNHAVLAVGYDLSSKFYITIKNSWGTYWGEDGYIRMALFARNLCGIATNALYPVP